MTATPLSQHPFCTAPERMQKIQKLEGLIFDLDGTLVDSNDLHTEAWQRAFAHHGKELDFATVRSQIGKGGDLLVPDLLNAREMRSFGEELKKFRKKLFQAEYMDRVRPFPGVSERLLEFSDAGIKIALASSADPDEVKHYIELLGIRKIIDAHTSKKDARFSKPSPEIFEAALEQLGVEEKTAAVGDTPYDILAAHRCVLPIIAVRSGGFPDEKLQKAEFLMNDVAELAERIDEVDDYFHHHQ